MTSLRKKSTTKPWQQARWKKKREEILTERRFCEICSQGPEQGKVLVLHHPTEMEETKRIPLLSKERVIYQWFHDPRFRDAVKALDTEEPATVRRLACPRGHVTVRWNVTLSAFVCYPCGRRTEPARVAVEEIDWVSPQERHRVGRLLYARFKQLYIREAQAAADAHNNAASESNAQAFDFYMSLEGIKVLCRGCHLSIHKGLKRCPSCNKRWMNPRYQTCFECLPEKRKKEIQSNQEDEHSIHRWLELVDKKYRGEELTAEEEEEIYR